ncbi:MAG: hypothetical protein QM765_48010 [Myxococcales bacterium]
MAWAIALAATAASISSASAMPATIVDQMTGAQFVERPVVGGTAFHCLGVGSRKAFVFKLYSVAFCLESSSADRVLDEALGWHGQEQGRTLAKSLERDERLFAALASAPGDKMIVLRFARNVNRGQLEGALRGALDDILPASDVARVVSAAACPDGVKEGEVALLRSKGDQFVVELGPVQRVLSRAETINERLWGIWLGPHSSTSNLKESIATRIARARDSSLR